MVSALSLIAANDALLTGSFYPTEDSVDDISDSEAKDMTTGVYPPCFHFLSKFGMYVFRFFKDTKWRYVVVDEFLCCKKDS